ncbi:hypothetical protein AOQ84DRAFT_380929 [Glonium stellatum]|uniref:Endoplasmic reticulum transmembrane protein n=1 Tax=Glonium stellatum TaxID=574774 RepID=A0A8E2ESP5_9PEZI|nr:hypothetical protein AOQ84DRAFT_380929 [Glonium stellatum]
MIYNNILLFLSWLVALWQDPGTASPTLVSFRADEPFWSFCFLDGSTFTSSFAPPPSPPASTAVGVFLDFAALYKALPYFLSAAHNIIGFLLVAWLFYTAVRCTTHCTPKIEGVLKSLQDCGRECCRLELLSSERLAIIEQGEKDLAAAKLRLSAAEAENSALKAKHAAEMKQLQAHLQPASRDSKDMLDAEMQAQRLKDVEEGYEILLAKYNATVGQLHDAHHKSIKAAAKRRGGRGRKKQTDNAPEGSEVPSDADKA